MALKQYFKTVSRIYEEEDIPDPCQYGANETGFQISGSMVEQVVRHRGVHHQSVQQLGDQDIITGVATVCADSSFLTPFIIFKGDQLHIAQGEDTLRELPCIIQYIYVFMC